MKNRILKFFIFFVFNLLMVQTAYAEVYTVNETIGDSQQIIYISGNPDLYPIEYYNNDTKQYEGVIPQLLQEISQRTKYNFVYLHNEKYRKVDFPKAEKYHIISSYVTGTNKPYVVDSVKIFSYEIDGKNANIGLAFTEKADRGAINAIKNEISKITEGEMNGYLLFAGVDDARDGNLIHLVIWACCIALLAVVGFVFIKLKKTERKMAENKLLDTDTGIGNLAYFEKCFNNTITDASRNEYYILYIVIDSNYLSVYHSESSFSDSVKYIAGVLKSRKGENEFSARITENGFAYAFQSCEFNAATKKIADLISNLNLFLNVKNGNKKLYFYATVYNLDVTDKNCSLLLYNLRKNCNMLNGSHKQLTICDRHMMNSAAEEKQLIEKIEKGFDKQEFKLYLQFIVDNKTKEFISAESLSRWELASGEVIPPAKYIGVMEKSGLISKLDYYMFEMACRQLHKWKDTEFDSFTLSCNFTRITISEKDFVSKIKEIAGKYVFDRRKLLFEITEDAIEKNMDIAMSNILKAKEFGFRIALDDMGSGYTSLINLCDYPIDVVKIDRNILLKTGQSNGKELFFGIISLAHNLNLKIVCEGVETEEQNALVSATGCDYIQGWYYSKPLPENKAEEFAREYMKNFR